MTIWPTTASRPLNRSGELQDSNVTVAALIDDTAELSVDLGRLFFVAEVRYRPWQTSPKVGAGESQV